MKPFRTMGQRRPSIIEELEQLSAANTMVHLQPPRSTKFAISFKVFFVLLLVMGSSIPASCYWWKLSLRLNKSVNDIYQQGNVSLEASFYQLQSVVIQNVSHVLVDIASPTETAVLYHMQRLLASGILQLDATTFANQFLAHANEFSDMVYSLNTSQYLAIANVVLMSYYPFGTERNLTTLVMQWFGYLRQQQNSQVLYAATYAFNSFHNDTELIQYTIDQTTGAFRSIVQRQPMGGIPLDTQHIPYVSGVDFGWIFTVNLGRPVIALRAATLTTDQRSNFAIMFHFNIYDLSARLLAMLPSSADRMFVFFQHTGDLLGTSHGSFYSENVTSAAQLDPLIDPPPPRIGQSRNTALRCTDEVVASLAASLLTSFQQWALVPALNEATNILGTTYWLTTQPIRTQTGLGVTVVFLMNYQSRMEGIVKNRNLALSRITALGRLELIILIPIVLGSVVVVIIISFVASRVLTRLEQGMLSLAILDFDTAAAFQTSLSRVSEVNECQQSLAALRRGMKAFTMFTSREVALLMTLGSQKSRIGGVTGRSQSFTNVGIDILARRIITIVFVDLVGFSTLCEAMCQHPEQLNQILIQYLNAMCGVIVKRKGTIDKFVGDCIEAMWNAPVKLEDHAVAATKAVLEMQDELCRLCTTWEEHEPEQHGRVQLRFRAGVNTTEALVGNFGCEYRIHYSCFGDGVNLASRLEATNKVYGTVAIVTEATYRDTCKSIYYRKLGSVTLSERFGLINLYEPICIGLPKSATANSTSEQSHFIPPNAVLDPISLPRENTSSSIPSQITYTSSRRLSEVALARRSEYEYIGSPLTPKSLFSPKFSASITGGENEYVSTDVVVYLWTLTALSAIVNMVTLYEGGLLELEQGHLLEAGGMFSNAMQAIPQQDPVSKYQLQHCRKLVPPTEISTIADPSVHEFPE